MGKAAEEWKFFMKQIYRKPLYKLLAKDSHYQHILLTIIQARSQAYVSGEAKLSQRSHVVRCLRAYVILYVIKVKWIMRVQKKLNFLVCHRNQGEAHSKFQEISPLLQRKSSKRDCKSIFSGVAKSWRPPTQGWHLPPHAPHGYLPATIDMEI